jgi:hypothetical protein
LNRARFANTDMEELKPSTRIKYWVLLAFFVAAVCDRRSLVISIRQQIAMCLAGWGLRSGGRVILDLWNQEFFAAHQGERELETAGGVVRESKCLNGDWLRVQLDYPGGAHEEFEWQLFTPAKMISLAQSVGLALLLVCTGFDSTITPSPAKPRIQFVLERSGKG